MRIASVYVPNGRSLDNDHYRYKLEWLARLHSLLERDHSPTEAIAICGDFNIAPTDDDVWDPAQFVGSTHVSQPERDALAKLSDWGLEDVFRKLQPEPGLFSWWDYRGGSFHKRQGMRIDLLLTTEAVTSRTTYAVVDRNARKGTQPSDHAPVIIDIAD